MRDIAQLKTVVSLVFKWSIEPLFSASLKSLSSGNSARIQEITTSSQQRPIGNLSSVIRRIFKLIFRQPPLACLPSTSAQGAAESSVSQTHITQTLITRYATDILRPAVFLAWYDRLQPEALDIKELLNHVKACTIRFLNLCV